MLQVIFFSFALIFSFDAFAQNVPAYLRNESGQPLQQVPQQDTSNLPAFLRNNSQERQELEQQRQYQQQIQPQEQYNYQSADPNSGIFTLPPSEEQQPVSAVPAFIQQEQNGEQQPQEDVNLRTNKKEDVIQINFSEDQYKPESEQSEVETLNKEEATKYNSEVQPTEQSTEVAAEGIKEGETAKGEDIASAEKDKLKKAEEEKNALVQSVPEPAKALANIMRINYSKEAIELTEKDKTDLLSVVKLLKSNKQQKVLIRSYTSERELGNDPRKVGLMRIIAVREFLMRQGVNFSQTEVKVIDPVLNKEDLDYIDIDKI